MNSAKEAADIEVFRAELVAALPPARQAITAMRAALDDAEEAARRTEEYALARRPMTELMRDVGSDMVRANLSSAAQELERTRHAVQRAFFRLLIAEGMTIADIARELRVSRTLVSRIVNEQS